MIPEIVELSEKLKSRVETKRIALEYPDAWSMIVVPSPPDTFPISASYEHGKWIISAVNWFNECEMIADLSSLLCWLLTPYYRIVESRRGPELLATWIEVYTDSGWESTEHAYFVEPSTLQSSETGATEMVIHQQAVFLDSAFTTHFPGAHLDQAGYPVGTLVGQTSYEFRGDGWHPVGVPIAE